MIECAKILYMAWDPSKDKPIELELSWVCDESKRMHQLVPAALKSEAEIAAKEGGKGGGSESVSEAGGGA